MAKHGRWWRMGMLVVLIACTTEAGSVDDTDAVADSGDADRDAEAPAPLDGGLGAPDATRARASHGETARRKSRRG